MAGTWRDPPPVAVLPSGKTNLIALDLGARGDPIETLERLIELARTDLAPYTVARELIALRRGEGGEERPVIGMFLGGAGLADTMIYCRERIYPLGLPNGMAHVITAFALLARMFLRVKSASFRLIPSRCAFPVRDGQNAITGRFSLLAVTTLEKLLLSGEVSGRRQGSLKLLAVEERPISLIRGFWRARSAGSGGPPARGPFRRGGRNHHSWRALQRHPGWRDVSGGTRPANQPHARATSVFREARGLNAPACRNCARSSRRSSACPSMRG